MTDRAIMLPILELLDQLDGVTIAENVLLKQVAMQVSPLPLPEDIRENLREAQVKGWIEQVTGFLSERRWRIVPKTGRDALDAIRGNR